MLFPMDYGLSEVTAQSEVAHLTVSSTNRNLYFLDEQSLELVTCSRWDGLWTIPKKIQTGEGY